MYTRSMETIYYKCTQVAEGHIFMKSPVAGGGLIQINVRRNPDIRNYMRKLAAKYASVSAKQILAYSNMRALNIAKLCAYM